MSSTCPQCGAQLAPGETCQDRFNLCLGKEVELAAYGAVHHLTVPSYMLQHNVYSRAGWLDARAGLTQFIYAGLMPAEARWRNRVRLDSHNRTWSVTKGPKLPGVENIQWTFTIVEVRLDTAENYCADVRHWADTILADSEALIRSSM